MSSGVSLGRTSGHASRDVRGHRGQFVCHVVVGGGHCGASHDMWERADATWGCGHYLFQ